MKLREYASIATGALVFTASVIAQWNWTSRPIQDVIFIALMLGFIGTSAVIILTEPERKQPRRKHRARRYEPDNFKVVTLNREDWN